MARFQVRARRRDCEDGKLRYEVSITRSEWREGAELAYDSARLDHCAEEARDAIWGLSRLAGQQPEDWGPGVNLARTLLAQVHAACEGG